MRRRNAQLQAIDVSTWPTVAYTQFDDTTRHMFEKRVQAVRAYVQGESVKQIEHATGIDRRQLYRWLERAGAIHADGRPFGFRALLRYARSTGYVRTRAVPDNIEPGGAASNMSSKPCACARRAGRQERRKDRNREQPPPSRRTGRAAGT